MAEYDGGITIGTGIDTSGIKKGAVQTYKLLANIAKNEKQIKSLKEQMESLGKQELPTAQMKNLEAQAGKAAEKVKKLKEQLAAAGSYKDQIKLQAKLEAAERERDKVAQQSDAIVGTEQGFVSGTDTAEYSKLAEKLSAAEARAQELNLRLSELSQKYPKGAAQARQLAQAENGVTSSTEQEKTALENLLEVVEAFPQVAAMAINGIRSAAGKILGFAYRFTGLKDVVDAVKGAVDKLKKAISELSLLKIALSGLKAAFTVIKNTVSGLLKTVQKLTSAIGKAIKGFFNLATGGILAKKSTSGLASTLKTIIPAMLGVRGVIGILRQAVSAYMSENTELSETLQNTWANLGNILGPIINRIVSMLSTAISYINSFFRALGITSKSATKAATAAGGAAAEVKKQVMSFDELNILNDQSSSGGGGGGADDADATIAAIPDEIQRFADKIKDAFESHAWRRLGKEFADKFNELFASVDWEGIAQKAGYFLSSAIQSLSSFVDNLDFEAIGHRLGESINKFFDEFTAKDMESGTSAAYEAGHLLSSRITKIGDFLLELIPTIDWDAIGQSIHDFFIGCFDNLYDWLTEADKWKTAGSDLYNAISGLVDGLDVGEMATSFWNAFGGAIQAGVNVVKGFIEGAASDVSGYWDDYIFEPQEYDDMGVPLERKLKSGEELIDGLKNGMLAGIANIGDWLKENVWNPILSGFATALGMDEEETLENDGENAVTNFLTGMKNKAGEIITWLQTDVLPPIKSWLLSTFEEIAATLATTIWNTVRYALNGVSYEQGKAADSASAAVATVKNSGLNPYTWAGTMQTPYYYKQDISKAYGISESEAVELYDAIRYLTEHDSLKAYSDEEIAQINEAVSLINSFLEAAGEIETPDTETVKEAGTSAADATSEQYSSQMEANEAGKTAADTTGTQYTAQTEAGEYGKTAADTTGNQFVSGIDGYGTEAGNTMGAAAANAMASTFAASVGSLGKSYVNFPALTSGITSSNIPKFATGAVIPPNAPFTAVLGDQRNGYNIETPESLLRQIVREESGGSGDYSEVAALLQELISTVGNIRVGDETIGRAAARYTRRTNRAGGV